MKFIYITDNQSITIISKSSFHRKQFFEKVGLHNNWLKIKKI